MGMTLLNAEAVYTVVGIAAGITIFSSLVHRKMVDRKEMDRIRARIEAHQKQYLAAQKANDKKEMARLEKEQAEVMKLVKENMMASMKPSLITLPIVLIIFWLLKVWYEGAGPIIEMPFGIPFLTSAVNGTINPITVHAVQNGMGWFGLYIVVSIGTAIILELVLRKVFKV